MEGILVSTPPAIRNGNPNLMKRNKNILISIEVIFMFIPLLSLTKLLNLSSIIVRYLH